MQRTIPLQEGNLVAIICCACVETLPIEGVGTVRDEVQKYLSERPELENFTAEYLKKAIDKAVGIKRNGALVRHMLQLSSPKMGFKFSELAYVVLVDTLKKFNADFHKHSSLLRELGRNLGAWEMTMEALFGHRESKATSTLHAIWENPDPDWGEVRGVTKMIWDITSEIRKEGGEAQIQQLSEAWITLRPYLAAEDAAEPFPGKELLGEVHGLAELVGEGHILREFFLLLSNIYYPETEEA